jgi:hypothetical protein
VKTEEIIRSIQEDLRETELNDVMLAMCEGFERANPQKELVCMVLPKQGKEERREILRFVCQKVMEEEFDKATGASIIRRNDTGKQNT